MADDRSLRERKKRQTRLDIVAAATALFRERGYEATTIDDIAERAGYSRRTFFRYFATKEDAAFGDGLARLESFRERLDDASGSGDRLALLRSGLREAALAFYAEPVDRASMDLWFREPALRRRFVEISEAWEQAAADFLAGGGPGPESAVDAQVIATAMCGVVKAALRARLRGPEEAAAVLDRGFALVTNGLHERTPA